MSRYIRNTAVAAKIETTYGTDSVPTGASNSLLVSNVTVNPLVAQNVDRDLLRPWLGASEQLVGTAYKEITFDVELAGSGTPGVAPPMAPLLLACGLEETIVTDEYVEYTPVSEDFDSSSIYVADAGDALHKLLGSRGNPEFALGLAGRPVIRFRFLGLDGGVTAAGISGIDYTNFQKPLVVTNANSGAITLGGTYSAGAISGGTMYTSTGLPALNFGNTLVHSALLGSEEIDITQREITGNVELDLTAAQDVTFMTNVKANTTQSMGMQHGTTAGNIALVFMQYAQLINPTIVNREGRRLGGYGYRAVPGPTGAGEFRLVFK
jgi:hypothetical protein